MTTLHADKARSRRRFHALAMPLLLAAAACLAPVGQADAGELDALFKRTAKRLKDEALRNAEDATRRPAQQAANEKPASTATPSAQSVGVAWNAPRADTRIGGVPQLRWLQPGHGRKFIPAEGAPQQVIAVNPYLSPEKPFFGTMDGLQCAADGSLVLAGEGGLDVAGGVAGTGWWRIAPDGAITPLVTRPDGSRHTVFPSPNFSLAPDGTLLVSSREAVLRVTPDGRARPVASVMDRPGMPVLDPSGNVWVSDRQRCELLRIAPDGRRTTVVGNDQGTCGEKAPEDRINVDNIAWDPVHGELVAGGGLIAAHPTHDMRITLWRIRPDGQARRVYYTLKAGRSPVGQNIDTIWALTVDDQGRIVVATRLLEDNARRQIMRLDESRGRLVVLSGQSFARSGSFDDYRPGHDEAPYDGPAAHASFRASKNICYGPDRTLFVLDEHQVRRFDTDGSVRTWAY
ncbi:hypothetical protein [Pseudoxanthomonas suwonensis]|uniref:NHL repeat containing protein n=1 Tax=Pseudoxanthomonas suwonensis TaxID=314722 RepID=A0A0E3Z1Z9_9GAMM|nr:hypothetical protein [Pseudoxanthomonas suwonensis]AKC86972.1 hypothetical protein WQ53_09630 [Pseudoxanthomonas suwonensis]